MSDDSQPRRRFQFSLKAFLLFVAAFAVVAGLSLFAIREFRKSLWGDANLVTLENQTGKMLEWASVSVSGQTVLWTAALAPNRTHMSHCGTGLVVVDGKFSDGTILHAETAGIPAGSVSKSFRIVIRPDGSLRLMSEPFRI